MPDLISILPPALHGGLMYISGWRGVGKTFLAAQADLPANIAFLDFEDKAEGLHKQLGFDLFRTPVSEAGGKDYIQVWNVTQAIVESLAQDRYTVCILDNISELEKAITADVAANPAVYAKRFGSNVKAVRNDSYGAARGCVNSTIALLAPALHRKGIKLVIAIAHIGEVYAGGQAVPNKRKVRGRGRWQDMSVLSLILGPGDHPPTPSAIVQKEALGLIAAPDLSDPEVLAAVMRGERGHTVQRRLPHRLPKCTFQEIRRYLASPADLDDPAPGEEAIPEEMAVFSSTLSREQIAFVIEANKAEALKQEEQKGVAAVVGQTSVNPLDQMRTQPAPPPKMTEEAQAQYDAILAKAKGLRMDMDDEEIRAALVGEGHPVPLVLRAMRESK
jgi:hypothetical protein